MQRGYKARIYPDKEQRIRLSCFFGMKRFVYNYFLDKRICAYREKGISLSYKDTSKMLTSLKHDKDYLWLNECDSMALQESLKDLDRAYGNFFKGNAKFPKFHSKRNKQSYRTRNQECGIRLAGNKVRIPKIGYVRYKGLRDFDGRIFNATVSMTPDGKYYISLCVESEDTVLSNNGGTIGLDVGIREFYTDSNGITVPGPKAYRKHEKKLIREQRRLSRKVKGSSNRNKQRIRLARQHEKIADIRNDFLHKRSRMLAVENQAVCVEDLNVKGMLKDRRLAGYISDASWSEFFRQLEYKTREHGGILIRVPAFYPSSQTCSSCGHKNPIVRDLSVREWDCPKCGAHHSRDVNAAKNILKEGLRMMSS